MFSINAWREGVEILKLNHNITYVDLSEKLSVTQYDAKEIIGNYCFINKIKRRKSKNEKQSDAKFYLDKLYSTGSKKIIKP